jgi:hypothetical protein
MFSVTAVRCPHGLIEHCQTAAPEIGRQIIQKLFSWTFLDDNVCRDASSTTSLVLGLQCGRRRHLLWSQNIRSDQSNLADFKVVK